MKNEIDESAISKLILGLQILQIYASTETWINSAGSGRRSISLQDEAFGQMKIEHTKALIELGWVQTGHLNWEF